MTHFDGVRRALRVRFGVRGVRGAIDDEIAFHLEARARDLVRGGLSSEDAEARALLEFGDVSAARRDLESIDRRRTSRRARVEWWADVGRDVVVAVRSLRRQPVLTAAMLVTLALGIGANAAIFGVMRAALIAPLPYARSDRLVHLWQTQSNDGRRSETSYPDFTDIRASVHAFSGVEGYDPTNVTVRDGDASTMIRGARVSAGFFTLLGVTPQTGRGFVRGEDEPGAPRTVLLSDGFWRRRFGSARDVVGRTMTIDGAEYAIIGVLPDRFHFAPAGAADVWVPLDRSAQTRVQRGNRWLSVVARLRDGVTLGSAADEMSIVMRRLAAAHPETNAGRGAVVVPLHDAVVGDVRPLLLVLTGAGTLVLLIACANVAGLLVARSLARVRDLAVRTALGATRWRIVRQVLTESVILSLAGGCLALWVAASGTRVLISAIPDGVRSGMPFWSTASGATAGTVAYTMLVALGVGVAFGLIPALGASRTSPGDVLRRSGRGVTGGGARLRDALVAGEIALTVVLLVGAGLLVRSLSHLMHVDRGFDAGQVVTARVALAGPRYAASSAQRRFFEDVLDRVRALPGVEAAGAVSNLPLGGGGTNAFRVVGAPEPSASQRPEAAFRAVAGDYFGAMRIPLIEGRQFTALDDSSTTPVVLVNARLARQLGGAGRAIGARVSFDAFPQREWEVIGVIGDVRSSRLDEAAPATIYYSQRQAPQNRMSLAVRIACPRAADAANANDQCTSSSITAVQRAVAASDPAVPVYGAATMEQQLIDSPAVFARRYPLLLVGLFGVTALVLAVVGLYGVISFSVVLQTRELGVRMALGADTRRIRGAVLWRGLRVSTIGLSIGVPGAFALTGAMRGMLYGVGRADPVTYLGASAVLVTVAMVACWIPARRATRISPTVALRAD